MLLGRERERSHIEGLMSGARVGQSAVLVLIGEVGIGKSSLLEDAASSATGMRLLRATGTEAEALAAALALRPGTGSDGFAVGAATLSLLSRFAEDQPLAVLLDDAHLLDQPSAQALVFAARRLTADPVVVLAAVRDGEPSPLLDAGLPILTVGGLSPAASGELVSASGRRLGRPV